MSLNLDAQTLAPRSPFVITCGLRKTAAEKWREFRSLRSQAAQPDPWTFQLSELLFPILFLSPPRFFLSLAAERVLHEAMVIVKFCLPF